MKKSILLLGTIVLCSAIWSCEQKPKEPTAEEIEAKVTERYGEALKTQMQIREMECAATIDAKVSEKLAAEIVTSK